MNIRMRLTLGSGVMAAFVLDLILVESSGTSTAGDEEVGMMILSLLVFFFPRTAGRLLQLGQRPMKPR